MDDQPIAQSTWFQKRGEGEFLRYLPINNLKRPKKPTLSGSVQAILAIERDWFPIRTGELDRNRGLEPGTGRRYRIAIFSGLASSRLAFPES